MDKYEVMLYPQAYRDIDEIYAYIALEKQAPENAQGQTDRIWDAIDSLEFFPQSHQDRLEGKYAGKGYKGIPAEVGESIRVEKKSKDCSDQGR